MFPYFTYHIYVEGIKEVSFYVHNLKERSWKYEEACYYANRRIDEGAEEVQMIIERN